MKRVVAALLAMLALGSCSRRDDKTHIYLQRFFGECGAEYGAGTDISKAEGECGIITTMIDRFNAENPDIHVDVNVVAWPGYPQLTAQVAARDPPDLVTMHEGVISDYALKGLVEPVDLYLRQANISPNDFTDASRAGVTIGRHIYGLPWDTHGGLFHVNTALFAKAGLMRGGKPVLPNSPDELIAQARQFEQRTGKPYLIQSNVGDPAFAARNLYTYMMAQGAVLFPDAHHIKLNTPVGVRGRDLLPPYQCRAPRHPEHGYAGAIAAFVSGEGGIYPTGTWMIGSFEQEADTPGRPLYKSYAVFPYPRLWGEHVEFVSGHGWVVPTRKRTPRSARRSRVFSSSWPRTIMTGRGPAISQRSSRCSTIRASGRSRTARTSRLSHRWDGRCRATSSARTRSKALSARKPPRRSPDKSPSPRALADAERRVNDLLGQLD